MIKSYAKIDQNIPSTESLPDNVIEFFEKRQITKAVLKRNKITFKNEAMLFPYFKDDEKLTLNTGLLTRNSGRRRMQRKCFMVWVISRTKAPFTLLKAKWINWH